MRCFDFDFDAMNPAVALFWALDIGNPMYVCGAGLEI